VHRYGGTAPQFLGDGFMALFGAPVTQKDHVRRALLAAVAIRRALSTDGDEAATDRLDLPVRIGINTGPVVFGPVGGGLAMQPTAIGDTANVAARLQEAAEPGTILLSEATWLLAQGYARVEPAQRLWRALAGSSPATWATASWFISDIRKRTRTMPSAPRAADWRWLIGCRSSIRPARIGIATGLVVVGGEVVEHDVAGDTPNLAARLRPWPSPTLS
jgi:class 3 adenylate cyclase